MTDQARNLRARGYELVPHLQANDELAGAGSPPPPSAAEIAALPYGEGGPTTHDVRGHFPFDGYEHPADHIHQATPSRPGWVGVQVSITVQVNLASWEANYGGDRPQDIPGMVREDARGAVEENLTRRGITAVVR